jgi:enamine deaminase RidA (YjgF/YER057c/UK114 family)
VLEKFNPPGVHETAGYSHVTITSEGRLAHLAGQCPLDLDGAVVGEPGDYDAQTDQVIANCLTVLSAAGASPEDVVRSIIDGVSPESTVLAAAGASPADVVRSIIYVVSPDSAVLAGVWRRLNASPLAPAFTTASTLLGVASLGYEGQLIEVDLTAAL